MMKKKLLLVGFVFTWISAVPAFSAGPVKIGIAARISPRETVMYYDQLIAYIGKKLGSPVEMVLKENYDDMDEMLERGEVEAAFLCSGPYVKDHARFGAELLVAPQAYGQPFYYAYIIVHKDSGIRDMAGLKGKRFAFTDPKSNTGALVPAYIVGREFKVRPEKFFDEVLYTRSHDKSIEMVAKKVADGASVDSLVFDYAARTNPVHTSHLRIIHKSPPFGIPPLVTRKETDPVLKNSIKKVLLGMHDDPEGRAILHAIMVDKFIVPKDSDYDSVRAMSDWLEKMK